MPETAVAASRDQSYAEIAKNLLQLENVLDTATIQGATCEGQFSASCQTVR